MKYVLIIFMGFNSSGGPATAEFGDKESCEAVVAIVSSRFSEWPKASLAVCVPYSSEPSK